MPLKQHLRLQLIAWGVLVLFFVIALSPMLLFSTVFSTLPTPTP